MRLRVLEEDRQSRQAPRSPSTSTSPAPLATDPPPREESFDIVLNTLPPPPISGRKATGASLPSLGVSSLDSPSTTSTDKPQEKLGPSDEFDILKNLINARFDAQARDQAMSEGGMDQKLDRLGASVGGLHASVGELKVSVNGLEERVGRLEESIITSLKRLLGKYLPL